MTAFARLPQPAARVGATAARVGATAALVLGVLVLVLGAGPTVATGDPVRHPELRDFLLSGQYVLYVGEKEIPEALIYHSKPSASYLVVADVLGSVVLVLPRRGCVESVESGDMTKQEDGSIDLVEDATPCELGKYWLEGAHVVFRVKDNTVRLKPKPPLVGSFWSDKLIKHSPEYARAAKSYRPDPTGLATLAGFQGKARVQIFFGTWCTFCNRFLPNTLKLEADLKKLNAGITFEFRGLPSPPAAWVTPEAERYRIRKLPTGLIFVGERQVGRLEGNDWIRPEISLSRVLK